VAPWFVPAALGRRVHRAAQPHHSQVWLVSRTPRRPPVSVRIERGTVAGWVWTADPCSPAPGGYSA
jgi:hypothetical protein